MKKSLVTIVLFFLVAQSYASYILIPMDVETQKNHLKAYGITYWTLKKELKVKWLLNYRGGSFLLPDTEAIYRSASWYVKEKQQAEALANSLGYQKVSQEKLAVALKIRDYVIGGGFMFAMCSATDSFDIALSAEGVDICETMFDGDGSSPAYQNKIDFNKTFAFTNYVLERSPLVYEFSSIDTTRKRAISKTTDYFSLMEFSAKWDPIPTMLCQNHTALVKGFMGQTTAFSREEIKSNVLVLGENKTNGEAKYIHGIKGKGFFTFYGGHDPEDYQHRVGDPKTELDLHPTSPGYRLILNNVLFPAAKKKKQKT